MSIANFNLLPNSKTYGQLAWPFITPYAIYVLVSSIPPSIVELWLQQTLKFIFVFLVLFIFRKNYRFGKLELKDIGVSVLVAPVLLCIWIYPAQLWFMILPDNNPVLGVGKIQHGVEYSIFRFLNSVFLVAIFEELFCRVYLMEFFYQTAKSESTSSLVDKVFSTIDERPKPLDELPLIKFSILGAALIFTVGHDFSLVASAFLYFLSTTLLYRLTKSFWVCILTHTFTNFGVFILATFYGMGYLWG